MKKPTEEIKQLINKTQPQIVGITCGSATYQRCIETAKAIKQVKPDCKIVVGGWHASYMPDSLLDNPEIDYVIMGEGERAVTELVNVITSGDEKKAALIAGVACKRNGANIKNQTYFYRKTWTKFPIQQDTYCRWNSNDRTIEYLDASPADVMSISRGCVFNCGFCETSKTLGQHMQRL